MFTQPTAPFLASPSDPRPWGPWRLDADHAELVFSDHATPTVIPLATCTTAAAVVDWCIQLAARGWAEAPAVISGLVVAVDDILDLRATLCTDARRGRPGGTITASYIDAQVQRFAAGPDGPEHVISHNHSYPERA